jgi:hypothetical protein
VKAVRSRLADPCEPSLEAGNSAVPYPAARIVSVSWRLLPVIELPYPDGVALPLDRDDDADRDRWERARAEALAIPFDAVLSANARIGQLPPVAWQRLLQNGWGDVDPVDGLDELHLRGGLALLADGAPVVRPGCCIWFDEAVDEWRRSIESPSDEWSMLWIGHPWVMVRRTGTDALAISRPAESSDPEDLVVLAEIPLHELRLALADALETAREATPALTEALELLGRSSHVSAEELLGLADRST